jgi:hypothetical protein
LEYGSHQTFLKQFASLAYSTELRVRQKDARFACVKTPMLISWPTIVPVSSSTTSSHIARFEIVIKVIIIERFQSTIIKLIEWFELIIKLIEPIKVLSSAARIVVQRPVKFVLSKVIAVEISSTISIVASTTRQTTIQ